MRRVTRRTVVGKVGRGAATLALAAGCTSPRLALAQGKRPQELRVLSESQAQTYGAWCDVLAVGAAEAGVAYFVDKYLAEPFPESLLLIRFLQNAPYKEFYMSGIAGIDQESQARFSKPFIALDKTQREDVVEAAVTSKTIAWTDPNPNFFFFISRSDAVDVVYGTVAGFRDLDIPYLQHIRPSRPW